MRAHALRDDLRGVPDAETVAARTFAGDADARSAAFLEGVPFRADPGALLVGEDAFLAGEDALLAGEVEREALRTGDAFECSGTRRTAPAFLGGAFVGEAFLAPAAAFFPGLFRTGESFKEAGTKALILPAAAGELPPALRGDFVILAARAERAAARVAAAVPAMALGIGQCCHERFQSRGMTAQAAQLARRRAALMRKRAASWVLRKARRLKTRSHSVRPEAVQREPSARLAGMTVIVLIQRAHAVVPAQSATRKAPKRTATAK